MKHIRTYEKYRITKNRDEIIKEAVLQVNDIYKVKTMIDIPQSLINSYVKKVKETTGKNLRQFFGDVDIAEEIVKYINMNNLDVEKIPGGALMGGQEETQVQAQEPQAQIQIEPQAQMQAQPQVQPEAQQAQPEAQGEFEEPQAQVQAQDGQSQVQAQGQGQVQPETQGQGQVQPETQGQVQPQAQEEDEEDEEELPL
jgi:hypothetical protein